MKKRTIAIIAEAIPPAAAAVSFLLTVSDYDSAAVRNVISVAFLLAFLGFAFFFIGRKLDRQSRVVRILGVFDWLATAYVLAFYIIAIFSFGL
ncbi:MAG: hypothetical protein IJM51_07545 [Clostridia bacterium]|nr:hypothetical protein [Clostridia bacterium]